MEKEARGRELFLGFLLGIWIFDIWFLFCFGLDLFSGTVGEKGDGERRGREM